MGNPTNQQRMEQIEGDLDPFLRSGGCIRRKNVQNQDNTDKSLARLLEGQKKLLERDGNSVHDQMRQKE